MRAARLHAPGDLRVGEEPAPAADAGMSLVRVTAVGICGSDLHWWDEGAIGDATLAHPLDVIRFQASAARRSGLEVLIEPLRCGSCVRCGWRRYSTAAACWRS